MVSGVIPSAGRGVCLMLMEMALSALVTAELNKGAELIPAIPKYVLKALR